MSDQENEIEQYGETGIYTKDKKIPVWLKLSYLLLPIWGVIWMFLYWNGAWGWVDRGHWNQLEKVANTQFPLQNANQPAEKNDSN